MNFSSSNECLEYLCGKGHTLQWIIFPWRKPLSYDEKGKIKEKICTKCGTIFTVNGGWFCNLPRAEWQIFSYVTDKWEDYNNLTCDETIIRSIIQ